MRRGVLPDFPEPEAGKPVSRANRLANRNAVPLTGVGKSVRLAVAAARKEKLPPEEAVKAAADFVTDTNDNDGVARAVERFCLS